MNDVAGIDQAQTDAPGERSGDLRVRKLEARIVDLRFVGLDRALELPDLRGLGVELLAGEDLLLVKRAVPVEIDLGVPESGLVAGELAFRLLDLDLEGARIDLGEDLPFLDVLPFLEADADQLSVHAALHGGGLEGGDRSQAAQVYGHVAGPGRHGSDRHGPGPFAPTSGRLAGPRPGVAHRQDGYDHESRGDPGPCLDSSRVAEVRSRIEGPSAEVLQPFDGHAFALPVQWAHHIFIPIAPPRGSKFRQGLSVDVSR
jgi:hypothetical protein